MGVSLSTLGIEAHPTLNLSSDVVAGVFGQAIVLYFMGHRSTGAILSAMGGAVAGTQLYHGFGPDKANG